MEPAAGRQPLDRRDRRAVGLDREHQARVDAQAVDEDGARAALADQAALLGAGQAEVVAQDLEQGVVGRDVERARAAVDGERDRDAASVIAVIPGRPSRSRAVADRPEAEHVEHRQAVLGARPHRARRRAGLDEQGLEALHPGPVRARRIGQHARSSAHEHRPRPDAAVGQPGDARVVDRAGQRDRGEVVAAPARPPDVDRADPAGRHAAARSR